MRQHLCVVVLMFFSIGRAVSAIASPLSVNGLGDNYIPGDTLAFEVTLPPLATLGAYNVDLVLTGSSGTAGVDFFFDIAATDAAASGYVFPSATNFFDALNVDSPLSHRLTLSDFDLTGAAVVAGVNDRIATVVIGTADGYLGELSLSFDIAGLILDTPDPVPTPVGEFDQIVADTLSAGDYQLSAVPEPASATLCVSAAIVGFVFLMMRQSRPMQRASSAESVVDTVSDELAS